MEGALVRRAPLPLTRRRGEAGLAARRTRLRSSPHGGCRGSVDLRGSRQRASEATSRARFAAENAATGRCRAEELSIEAPPGPRGALFDARARGSNPRRTQGTGRARWLKLEGRRQATLHPWIGRRSNDRRRIGALRSSPARGDAPRGVRASRYARESEGPCGVHVIVSRLQKSERGIFLRARSVRLTGRGASAGIA